MWLQIPLGLDNPRRITYHNMLKMYGVVCVRSEPIRQGEPESVASSFKILNETSFSRKCRTVHLFIYFICRTLSA
jgi:DNA damage-binding protein 1